MRTRQAECGTLALSNTRFWSPSMGNSYEIGCAVFTIKKKIDACITGNEGACRFAKLDVGCIRELYKMVP